MKLKIKILNLIARLFKLHVLIPPVSIGDTVYCEYNTKTITGTVIKIRPFITDSEIIYKGNILCYVDNPFHKSGVEEIELYVVFEKPYGCERIAYKK